MHGERYSKGQYMNTRKQVAQNDAPILTAMLTMSVVIVAPIILIVLFTKWADSPMRQAVAVVGLVIMLGFAVKKEKLYSLVFGLILFTQFSVSLHSFEMTPPALFQIFFMDIIIVLLLWTAIERREHWHFDTLAWLFLVLIVWVGVATANSVHVDRSLIYLSWQIKFFIIYLIFLNVPLNENIAKYVVFAVLLAVGFQSLLALIQFAHGGVLGLSILGEPTGDSLHFVKGTLRVFGTLGTVNALAGYLAMLLVLLVPFVFVRKDVLLYGVFGLGSVALLLSFSRAGWLSLFLGGFIVVVLLARMKRIRFSRLIFIGIFASALMGILIIMFMDRIVDRFEGRQAVSSAESRIVFVAQAWEVINKYPIFGIGPGVTEYFGSWNSNKKYVKKALPGVHLDNQVHNGHIQIWMEAGTLGFIIWMIIIAIVVVSPFRRSVQGDGKNTVSLLQIGAAVAAFAAIVHSSFGTEINNYRIMLLFWALLALSRNHNLQQNAQHKIEDHLHLRK